MTGKCEEQILNYLREASIDRSIKEIAKATGINRNTVSKYLNVLQERRQVKLERRVGRAQMYKVAGQDHATIETDKKLSVFAHYKRLKRELEEKNRYYNSFQFRVLQSFKDSIMPLREGREYSCNAFPLEWLEEKLKQGLIEISSPASNTELDKPKFQNRKETGS